MQLISHQKFQTQKIQLKNIDQQIEDSLIGTTEVNILSLLHTINPEQLANDTREHQSPFLAPILVKNALTKYKQKGKSAQAPTLKVGVT